MEEQAEQGGKQETFYESVRRIHVEADKPEPTRVDEWKGWVVRVSLKDGTYAFQCPVCHRGHSVRDLGPFLCTCGVWSDVRNG